MMIQTSLGPLEAVLELHKGHKSWTSVRIFKNSSEIHLGALRNQWKIMKNHENRGFFRKLHAKYALAPRYKCAQSVPDTLVGLQRLNLTC